MKPPWASSAPDLGGPDIFQVLTSHPQAAVGALRLKKGPDLGRTGQLMRAGILCRDAPVWTVLFVCKPEVKVKIITIWLKLYIKTSW